MSSCNNPSICEYWFCNTKEKCLLDKQSSTPLRFKKPKKAKEKIILKPKYETEKPLQPLPITWENFFLATKGEFDEIFEIPNNYESIFKSKGSEYFINDEKTILIRKSDHWGFGIRNCHWYLKGYPRLHCGTWQKKQEQPLKIGIIKISELKEAIKPKKKRTFQSNEFILTDQILEKIHKK